MSILRVWTALLLGSALLSCAKAPAPRCARDDRCTPGSTAAPSQTPTFTRSPGGTSEVAPEAVAIGLADPRHLLRVIDVREREELDDDLGHIAEADWVPLGQLAEASESWDPAAPIVLVCRSGRRSARGAEQLEALGFRNVASMTGGMLRWTELRLPVRRDPVAAAGDELLPAARADGRGAPVQLDPEHVRWVRTGALLATGSESCVDGREPHAVIGTPGGDAGELILALAAVEKASGQTLTEREIEALLDAWVDAFGRLYVHSDLHALEALRDALIRDPRFEGVTTSLAQAAAIENLVRHPPRALEPALLDHLIEPQHVGCGHLRSMLLSPESYQARRALVVATLRGIFARLWRAPEAIDWVVLSGEHHERAVVVVRLDGEIRPYTKLPAIAPSSEFGQAFVTHPQATAYLREQNAYFLLEQLPWLRERVTQEELSTAIRSLADVQLEATLARLASGLPRYEVRFQGRLPAQVKRLAARAP